MIKVPKERWQAAQDWESQIWLKENASPLRKLVRGWLAEIGVRRFMGNDWNDWWAEKLDHYRVVPPELDNVIELGCGPYTNIRLICAQRQVRHIMCSDPLVKHYLRFRGRWLSEAWRHGAVLLDDHPAEECPYASDYFDLTVLINVLDHVRDAVLCLSQAVRVTRPGGLLIVGQDLTNSDDLNNPEVKEDIGHPLRLTHDLLDEHLTTVFEPLLYRILPRAEGRNPAAHYGTYLFIGRKRVNRA